MRGVDAKDKNGEEAYLEITDNKRKISIMTCINDRSSGGRKFIQSNNKQ